MSTIGYATLDIIPSLKGASAQISRQLAPSLSSAGKEAGLVVGRQAGSGLKAGLDASSRSASSSIGTNLEKGAVVAGTGYGRRFGAALHESVSEYGKTIGASLVGFFAFEKAKEFFKGTLEEAEQAKKVADLTDQVIKSTGGAAGISAKQVGDLANSLSAKVGVDDEAIQSGENLLLTFKNIRNETGKGNDIFNQATQSFVDMAAGMAAASGGAVNYRSAVTLVGKALNDPIKGLSALNRAGVTFTSQQQAQIKALVGSGHAMDAQKVILTELKSEFGGAAEALATPAEKAQVAWKNFEETLGLKVLPILDEVATAGATSLNGVVTGVSAIPGPLKSATLAWLAFTAAQKLGVGRSVASGLETVRLKAMLTADSYRALTVAEDGAAAGAGRLRAASMLAGRGLATGLSRGLSGALSIVGGPWGAAFLAGTAVVTHFWQAHQEAKAHVDALTQSLDAESGAVTASTKATVYDALVKSGAIDQAKSLGLSLGVVTDAALGNADALGQLRAAQAAATATTAQNNAANADAARLHVQGGAAIGDLINKVTGESGALRTATQAYQDRKQALAGSTSATRGSAAATEQATAAAKANAKANAEAAAALKKSRDAARSQAQQFITLGKDIDNTKVSLNGWIKEMSKEAQALTEFTKNAKEAGRKGLREGLVKELEKAGPAGALRLAQLADASKSEIGKANAAYAAGRRAIRRYTDAVGGLQHQIDALHGKKVTVTLAINGASHAASVQAQLADIRGTRAVGGPVAANSTYLVGERGPELFRPKVPGSIVPNTQVAAALSTTPNAAGGVTVQIGTVQAHDYADFMAQAQNRARRASSDGVRR